MKSDVLVRAGEAAKVLNVNQATIHDFVRQKVLTPTPYSNRIKFWLSEVKSVAKKAGLLNEQSNFIAKVTKDVEVG